MEGQGEIPGRQENILLQEGSMEGQGEIPGRQENSPLQGQGSMAGRGGRPGGRRIGSRGSGHGARGRQDGRPDRSGDGSRAREARDSGRGGTRSLGHGAREGVQRSGSTRDGTVSRQATASRGQEDGARKRQAGSRRAEGDTEPEGAVSSVSVNIRDVPSRLLPYVQVINSSHGERLCNPCNENLKLQSPSVHARTRQYQTNEMKETMVKLEQYLDESFAFRRSLIKSASLGKRAENEMDKKLSTDGTRSRPDETGSPCLYKNGSLKNVVHFKKLMCTLRDLRIIWQVHFYNTSKIDLESDYNFKSRDVFPPTGVARLTRSEQAVDDTRGKRKGDERTTRQIQRECVWLNNTIWDYLEDLHKVTQKLFRQAFAAIATHRCISDDDPISSGTLRATLLRTISCNKPKYSRRLRTSAANAREFVKVPVWCQDFTWLIQKANADYRAMQPPYPDRVKEQSRKIYCAHKTNLLNFTTTKKLVPGYRIIATVGSNVKEYAFKVCITSEFMDPLTEKCKEEANESSAEDLTNTNQKIREEASAAEDLVTTKQDKEEASASGAEKQTSKDLALDESQIKSGVPYDKSQNKSGVSYDKKERKRKEKEKPKARQLQIIKKYEKNEGKRKDKPSVQSFTANQTTEQQSEGNSTEQDEDVEERRERFHRQMEEQQLEKKKAKEEEEEQQTAANNITNQQPRQSQTSDLPEKTRPPKTRSSTQAGDETARDLTDTAVGTGTQQRQTPDGEMQASRRQTSDELATQARRGKRSTTQPAGKQEPGTGGPEVDDQSVEQGARSQLMGHQPSSGSQLTGHQPSSGSQLTGHQPSSGQSKQAPNREQSQLQSAAQHMSGQSSKATQQSSQVTTELLSSKTTPQSSQVTTELQSSKATPQSSQVTTDLQFSKATPQSTKMTMELQSPMATPQSSQVTTELQSPKATPQSSQVTTELLSSKSTPQSSQVTTELHSSKATPQSSGVTTDLQFSKATPQSTKMTTELQSPMATPQSSQVTTELQSPKATPQSSQVTTELLSSKATPQSSQVTMDLQSLKATPQRSQVTTELHSSKATPQSTKMTTELQSSKATPQSSQVTMELHSPKATPESSQVTTELQSSKATPQSSQVNTELQSPNTPQSSGMPPERRSPHKAASSGQEADIVEKEGRSAGEEMETVTKWDSHTHGAPQGTSEPSGTSAIMSASNNTTPGSAPDFRQPQGTSPTLSETAPPPPPPQSQPSPSSSSTTTAATGTTTRIIRPDHAAAGRQLSEVAAALIASLKDLNQRSERWKSVLNETREGMRLQFASMEQQSSALFGRVLQETRSRVRAKMEEEKQRRRHHHHHCGQPEQSPEEARMSGLLHRFQASYSHTIVTPEQFHRKVDAVQKARSAEVDGFDRLRDDISSDFRAAFGRR